MALCYEAAYARLPCPPRRHKHGLDGRYAVAENVQKKQQTKSPRREYQENRDWYQDCRRDLPPVSQASQYWS